MGAEGLRVGGRESRASRKCFLRIPVAWHGASGRGRASEKAEFLLVSATKQCLGHKRPEPHFPFLENGDSSHRRAVDYQAGNVCEAPASVPGA